MVCNVMLWCMMLCAVLWCSPLCFGAVSRLSEPPVMSGCYEPNLELRDAQRLFEDQIQGPESIVNIGGTWGAEG